MVSEKFNTSRGWISRTLIILAVVIFVAILIVFFAIRFSSNVSRSKSVSISEGKPPEMIYETTLSDVRFLFESAQDLGSVLKASEARSAYQQDVTTTEKFIKLTIRAQNKGKNNLQKFNWDVGNIIDSDGRNFPPSDKVFYYLPIPDTCGEVLKPEFEPIPCVKIYEVSRVSTKLKVQVSGTNENGKKQSAFLDLDVK